jgi:hypothetical protein
VDSWLIFSPREHQIAFLGAQKQKKQKNIHKNTSAYIYIYIYAHGDFWDASKSGVLH